MKIAAIDLGTNTFHLIIAHRKDNKLSVIYKTNSPVKLGEDITKENLIIPAAFERGVDCLKAFKAIIEDFKIDKIRAVATSGVRSASNGKEFINKVEKETGIVIDVIDGDEEAELIYQGIKLSGAIKKKSLIIDIGGGSTEFIFCDENQYYWKQSFDIGAARLMQKFFKSDPISDADIKLLLAHLDDTLTELISYGKEFGAINLIGSAGAFETFAKMIDPDFDIRNAAKTVVAMNKYRLLSQHLIASTHDERSAMQDLIPLRVDMIVMACILTDYVINKLKIKKIMVSTFDLKMGVLQSLT